MKSSGRYCRAGTWRDEIIGNLLHSFVKRIFILRAYSFVPELLPFVHGLSKWLAVAGRDLSDMDFHLVGLGVRRDHNVDIRRKIFL